MGDVLAQYTEQPGRVGFVLHWRGATADVVQLGNGHIVDDRACVIVACSQMIQRQIARGLENEGLKIIDGPIPEYAVNSQPCVMEQIFSRGGVVYDPLQGAQQSGALDDEQVIERRLTHKSTLPKKDADDNAYHLRVDQ